MFTHMIRADYEGIIITVKWEMFASMFFRCICDFENSSIFEILKIRENL